MGRSHETRDETTPRTRNESRVPGVLFVQCGTSPTFHVVPLRGAELHLGRGLLDDLELEDERVSRHHAVLAFDDGGWTVRDLGSRNGTSVDATAVRGEVRARAPAVVRFGSTIVVPVADVAPLAGTGLRVEGELVIGPRLDAALREIAAARSTGARSLLVLGETGTGKERASQEFHARGPRAAGPFVAVNCAAIPAGLAERLLFGAVRGAFSGASTAKGYVQAADGGVLFLDEIGELALDVQAKLLRVLETREVTMLGATESRTVDVRFCFATHRDLRESIAAERFRADLFYRIAQPEVVLPPLRERPEEVPWVLAERAKQVAHDLLVHAKVVEACLVRRWPGNLRELAAEATRAARAAVSSGSSVVREVHLSATAGHATHAEPAAAEPAPRAPFGRPEIERALEQNDGNVAATARSLGVHRTQLYRELRRLGIEPPREP